MAQSSHKVKLSLLKMGTIPNDLQVEMLFSKVWNYSLFAACQFYTISNTPSNWLKMSEGALEGAELGTWALNTVASGRGRTGKTKCPETSLCQTWKQHLFWPWCSSKTIWNLWEVPIICKTASLLHRLQYFIQVDDHPTTLKQFMRPICVWNIYVTPGRPTHNQIS